MALPGNLEGFKIKLNLRTRSFWARSTFQKNIRLIMEVFSVLLNCILLNISVKELLLRRVWFLLGLGKVWVSFGLGKVWVRFGLGQISDIKLRK